ncbi:MAG: OmpA family protein [Bacteroidia bacterium]|jgi:outer membrane protein OmpA-like peptidoglycan-associated protein
MRNIFFCFLIVYNVCAAQNIENAGPQVNSQYDELAPYITPDGKKLFFVRVNHPQNTLMPEKTQDIWYCKLENNGTWGTAKHLGPPFNKTWYNSVFYQSADGNTRIIRGDFKKGSFKGSGFSSTHLLKDGWSEPEGINVKKYERMSNGKSAGICIGSDNKTMLFYLSEEDEKNCNYNLYVSFFQKDNTWSAPEPLGADINTAYYEMAPFLAADNITLYFSSDRPGGYGSNDIYMSRRLDDSWKKWSAPVNLGPSVNSSEWDAYYTIPASGNYAYMVSGKNSLGGTDIVKIKLAEEVKPKPVVLITGKVLDAKTKQPVSADIKYHYLPEGKEAGIANSNVSNGEYQIILPYGHTYGYRAEAPGYYAVSENLDLSDLKEYKEMVQDLYLVPIQTGEVIRLNNIFFNTGKWELKNESFIELNRVAELLKNNPTMQIAIAGHTDNVGADDINMQLSANRAKAVVDYLISQGITAERLSSEGFGKNKPVATNDTEEGKRENRRVEFTIIKK